MKIHESKCKNERTWIAKDYGNVKKSLNLAVFTSLTPTISEIRLEYNIDETSTILNLTKIIEKNNFMIMITTLYIMHATQDT